MTRTPLLVALAAAVAPGAAGQTPSSRPPVIDVHTHATVIRPEMLARLDSLDVRYVVVAGVASHIGVASETVWV